MFFNKAHICDKYRMHVYETISDNNKSGSSLPVGAAAGGGTAAAMLIVLMVVLFVFIKKRRSLKGNFDLHYTSLVNYRSLYSSG